MCHSPRSVLQGTGVQTGLASPGCWWQLGRDSSPLVMHSGLPRPILTSRELGLLLIRLLNEQENGRA